MFEPDVVVESGEISCRTASTSRVLVHRRRRVHAECDCWQNLTGNINPRLFSSFE